MFIKDGIIKNLFEIMQLNPSISFGPNTVYELGYTDYIPPPIMLEVLKSNKIAEIKSTRDYRATRGYQTGGKWYHSDAGSRIQQLGLVMLGSNIPPGLQWKTMDGTFVTMTSTLAQQIFQAAVTSDATLFSTAEVYITQVNAAVDEAEVNAVTPVWPPIFSA